MSFISSQVLLSCGDDYKKRRDDELVKFNKNISQEQQELITNFYNGTIKAEKKTRDIEGGVYCLWKEKNKGYIPHLTLNHLLLKDGYQITSNKDSLNYIIITETVSHIVGRYSNGATAAQIETVISAIDLKRNSAFIIRKEMGSLPPETIYVKNGSDRGSIGSFWGDDDIFEFLKSEIKK